jgi:hypothetical protein
MYLEVIDEGGDVALVLQQVHRVRIASHARQLLGHLESKVLGIALSRQKSHEKGGVCRLPLPARAHTNSQNSYVAESTTCTAEQMSSVLQFYTRPTQGPQQGWGACVVFTVEGLGFRVQQGWGAFVVF